MSLAELAQTVLDYSRERLELDPVPLDRTLTPAELQEQAGQTITRAGIGGQQAMDLFTEVLAPACLSVDHPRYLSFIPCAPTEAAAMFDLVVGASSIYAGSWLEGSGAVYAENQALRWIADLVGLPESAGGVFVPGGTIGMGIASGLATFWAALGVWVAVFPGTLENLFGLEYDFLDTWNVSRVRFEAFTLGTLAVLTVIAVAGYLAARRSRRSTSLTVEQR